jgi:hypothetical protein
LDERRLLAIELAPLVLLLFMLQVALEVVSELLFFLMVMPLLESFCVTDSPLGTAVQYLLNRAAAFIEVAEAEGACQPWTEFLGRNWCNGYKQQYGYSSHWYVWAIIQSCQSATANSRWCSGRRSPTVPSLCGAFRQ